MIRVLRFVAQQRTDATHDPTRGERQTKTDVIFIMCTRPSKPAYLGFVPTKCDAHMIRCCPASLCLKFGSFLRHVSVTVVRVTLSHLSRTLVSHIFHCRPARLSLTVAPRMAHVCLNAAYASLPRGFAPASLLPHVHPTCWPMECLRGHTCVSRLPHVGR